MREVAGNSSLESSLAARREGLASSCGISSSRLRTSRSTSLAAKAGARRASASRPRPLARREAGTSRLSRTPGWSACASRVAPARSSSAANSSAECLSVPSEKARAMIVATPSRPAGSASSGASSSTSTATTCCPGRWQRSTVRPLSSAVRSGAGNAHGLASPGCGWGWKSMVASSVTWPSPRSRSRRGPPLRSLPARGPRGPWRPRRPPATSARRRGPRGCRAAGGPWRPPGPPPG